MPYFYLKVAKIVKLNRPTFSSGDWPLTRFFVRYFIARLTPKLLFCPLTPSAAGWL